MIQINAHLNVNIHFHWNISEMNLKSLERYFELDFISFTGNVNIQQITLYVVTNFK